MKRMIAAGAALALLLPATAVLAQQPAKGKDATPPKAAAVTAPAGKTLYPQSQFDLLLKERLARAELSAGASSRDEVSAGVSTTGVAGVSGAFTLSADESGGLEGYLSRSQRAEKAQPFL